jgi:glycosyltransferase involved in cell wall biosynthesis
MHEVLLSIVIPVYNTEKYLWRCMNSILCQGGGSYEIILVDDGSTDGSPEICDAYSRQYENVTVVHQTNAGVSSARNHGLELAEGKYVWFCDSDDRLLPHALETVLKTVSVSSPELIVFPVVEEDSEERALGIIPAPKALGYTHNGPLVAGDLLYLYAHVLSRQIIQNERFDTSLCLLEDRDFLYRVCCKANKEIVVIDWPLYAYLISRADSAVNSLDVSKRVDANIVQLQILEAELSHSRCSPAYELFVTHTLGVLALLCKHGGPDESFGQLRKRLLAFDYLHKHLHGALREKYLLCKYFPNIYRALYIVKGRLSKTRRLGSTVIGDANPM